MGHRAMRSVDASADRHKGRSLRWRLIRHRVPMEMMGTLESIVLSLSSRLDKASTIGSPHEASEAESGKADVRG